MPAIFCRNAAKPSCFFSLLTRSTNLVLLPRETTSEPPKVVRTPSVLNMLTSNVLRATTACTFFEIWTFQKWSEPLVFLTFWLRMCFAPQRRALFRHLNCQSGPHLVCFVHFWFRNVLCATTACTFSTSQLPKWSEPLVFLTFWLQMCFAPQQRALFRDLNFQKWSEPLVF